MSRLQLNKSSLAKQSRDLTSFSRYLPSLDLKRQQLMLEKAKSTKQKRQLSEKFKLLLGVVKVQLPMLANEEISLEGLVSTPVITVNSENVLGVTLPVIKQINQSEADYTLLARPHWVDNYIDYMNQALELQARIALEAEREARLTQAIKIITQRVNLFEKVLIPKAKANIKRIKIFLSDEQMTSVVRSKIAKKKRQDKQL